jgi:hypothetical protein
MQARNHLPCQHYNVVLDNSTAITSASVRTWKPPVCTTPDTTTTTTTTTTATSTAATIGTTVPDASVAATEVLLAILQRYFGN